jgi:TRAP-type C4-dicarboxylate transport system permease small subunit
MTLYRWWIIRIVVVAVCLFFIYFGINLLAGAYHLEVPQYFILTFFASNFIILFSLAILVGFCLQMYSRLRKKSYKSPADEISKNGNDEV